MCDNASPGLTKNVIRHRMSENPAQVNHVESTFCGDCLKGGFFANPEAQIYVVAINRLETENVFRLIVSFEINQ